MFRSRKVRMLLMAGMLAITGAATIAQAPPKLQPGEDIPNTKPPILDQVGLDQHLNQQIPLDAMFVDENGQPVELGQYFGSKPVILSLVYFQCPMLCSQVQNGLTGALNGIVRFNVGRDFNVLTVSFDPRDTAQDAALDKKTYVSRYRREGASAGWHFLTGRKDQIDRLAAAVGFRYAWDPKAKQFAHASGIMVLTPDGRLSRYFYGIEYYPRDVQFGLIDASHGRIGNLADQVLLYCFHYDPTQGRYSAAILNIMRVFAVVTLVVLGGFMLIMFRRDFRTARQSRVT